MKLNEYEHLIISRINRKITAKSNRKCIQFSVSNSSKLFIQDGAN